jgi:putative DNA methylase
MTLPSITVGPAQALETIGDDSIRCICVDPPYYDNVMYSECSNFFYVWMKRVLGGRHPDLCSSELTNSEDEAVMNTARFKSMGKKAKALATADYENKMFACFKEMNRILHPDGVLTVMFTHKQVQAWDTLGSSLMRAGFRIDASWPVHTESEASLHQAKKNAAASTILLVCRKREASGDTAWWDDLKGQVRETARETAQRFEKDGIRGVDLYISTFGPVLSIISERWPVLTSNTDPKTGDPIPLQPGDALDLARREVINLRKQGLLLGRSVEFDPVTDWYLMAWDAFRAQEFPADEAIKLALALGLDLEANLVRDKRLIAKKGKNVSIALPTARRKKGMVDPEADSFTHLIDALHTAMMVYEEDGSKACQVFIDRHGLRNDSRIKALVQAAMQAIPTTRGKDGRFLRPEMTTLDALRDVIWDDLPAPPEEEMPKIDTQMLMFGKPSSDQEDDETDEEFDEDSEDDDEESDDE